MEIQDLMQQALDKKASDLHIKAGSPPSFRIYGELISIGSEILTPEDTMKFARQILDDERFEILQRDGEIDFAYSCRGLGRFRVNAYKQRNTIAIACRVVHFDIPSLRDLSLPESIGDFSNLTHGLVLVTGPTGSGKSTTIASIVDMINKKRKCHIITLEDPIEYLYKNDKAVIGQREIGMDTMAFDKGLRAAMREDPDVIVVGEMRDLETIEIALLAAETGHLVLSTLHTLGAAKTIDRIIDSFPTSTKDQIKMQLSSVLQAVVSQQLMPRRDGRGRVPACEVMIATNGILNLIRESKTHQIQNAIVTGMNVGMITMDNSLKSLYQKGIITRDEAINHALDRDDMIKNMDI